MLREGARFGAMLAWLLFAVRDGGRMEYRGVECEKVGDWVMDGNETLNMSC